MSRITMSVVNPDEDHFIVTTYAPARFEVSLLPLPDGGAGIIMHGYWGVIRDSEQEPSVVYDGSIRGWNSDQCRRIPDTGHSITPDGALRAALDDPRFRQAVDEVFAAPGVEFGPAKGYYGGDTGHFIDMLRAALAASATDEYTCE